MSSGTQAWRRTLVVALLTAAIGLAGAAAALAHPLGNFTTNTFAGLAVAPQSVRVDYVLDLAEIPALHARQLMDTDRDDAVSPAEADRYRVEQCAAVGTNLAVTVGTAPLPLAVESSRLDFPSGQAGLTTLRLECGLTGSVHLGPEPVAIRVEDNNYPDRIGWREMTASGDGATILRADVPAVSISGRLTAYPEDRVRSPLAQRSAEILVRPGGAAAAPTGQSAANSRRPLLGGRGDQLLAGLTAGRRLTLGFAVGAVLLALVLGGAHALAPGHGKTIVAACAVGAEGTAGQALLMGASVAVTHTLGVGVLGLVLLTSQTFAAERVYPWLTLASGVLILMLGARLLRRSMHGQSHDHGNPAHHGGHNRGGHDHVEHDHNHGGPDHDHQPHQAHQPHQPQQPQQPQQPHQPHQHHQHHQPYHPHSLSQSHQPHQPHRPPLPRQPRQPHQPYQPRQPRQPHQHHPDGHRDHDQLVQRRRDGHRNRHRPVQRRRDLLALGFAGGLVPSPSAAVVLVGATAMGRAPLGIALVTAYGVGLATTLITIALVAARARSALVRMTVPAAFRRLLQPTRALPAVGGGIVMLGGVLVVARALTSL